MYMTLDIMSMFQLFLEATGSAPSSGSTRDRAGIEADRPTAPSATDMPSPQTRPALLIARKTDPLAMAAASVHLSTEAFTQVGIGTVRTWPALPTRSAITQASRCWIDSTHRANGSARRSPHPINMATIAWSRSSRSVDGLVHLRSRRPCSTVSQFPRRTPIRRTPFTRRMPAASSGLRRLTSAASYAIRPTAASRRLIVAGAYPRCSR